MKVVTERADREWYEPEWAGNRELPEGERIRVKICPADYGAFSSLSGPAVAGNVIALQTEFVAQRAEAIENLIIDGKPISTGPQLVTKATAPGRHSDPPLSDLIAELFRRITRSMEVIEEEEKNSDAPPASS